MRPLRAAAFAGPLVGGLAAARGEDAAELALRARDAVPLVFSRPEFSPLADADRIPDFGIEVDDTLFASLRRFLAEIGEPLFEWLFDALGGLFEWFGQGLRRLFGGGGSALGGALAGQWIAWTVGAAALVLIAWMVVRLLRTRARERAGRAALLATGPQDAVGADDALARTPDDWRRSAAELEQGGRRREALRALYLALLAQLHHAGAIDYDRTRTNTAYVHDVPSSHPAHRPFASLTWRFDVAWYGGREPDPGHLSDARAEAEEVILRLGATEASPA